MQTKGTETLAPPPLTIIHRLSRTAGSFWLFVRTDFRLEWLHSKNISDALRDQRQSFWKFFLFLQPLSKLPPGDARLLKWRPLHDRYQDECAFKKNTYIFFAQPQHYWKFDRRNHECISKTCRVEGTRVGKCGGVGGWGGWY